MSPNRIQIHRLWFVAIVAFISSAISGAQGAQSGGGRRRRPGFPDVNRIRNVVYKKIGERSLRLDIYTPKTIVHPLPVALWIHGGGWSQGRKEQRPPVDLMAHGYAIVSIEYRLSDEAPFPAQIEDCKAAVRWLRANAVTYHFDPDHIGAWGHSAGGHLAALLGTSGGVAALEGGGDNLSYSSRIQAVCDLSGPSDIWPLYQGAAHAPEGGGRRARMFVEHFLGEKGDVDKGTAIAASPVTYISKDDPPFLVIHGEKDLAIPVAQSEEFVQELKAAGVNATLDVAEGRGHGVAAREFASQITNFFDNNLKGGAPSK
jgi:acetyl esterase/lipase